MRKKIKYGMLVCLMLSASGLYGQRFLTLDSCRIMACMNNSQSRIAQIQVEKMRYEVNAYRANFFPRIFAQGMYLFTTGEFDYNKRYDMYNTSIPGTINGLTGRYPLPAEVLSYLDRFYKGIYIDLDIKVKPSNSFFVGMQFEQPVFMGGKIITAYRMSKTGRQLAQLNETRSQAEVLFKTDQAYWQYVKVTALYNTAVAYKEAVANILTDVQNGVETGMVSENDRMKVQVKLGEANLMLKQAENGKRLAQMNLCMVIGLNLFTSIVVTDTLSDETLSLLPATIPDVTVRPEYALLKKQIELKKQQISLVRSDFLPQLGITGGYHYLNGVWLNDTKLFDKTSFSAIVSLKIPITQWGEGSYRIRSARADLLMEEYRMQETTDLLQME
ncbi:MAG: TolC family protein, partial [Bacteroidales bacterium]|nr:TolC family protein [Bacteroidales bacterium]